ncbi:alpha/beta fold hydrolase [Shimia sagamensis]|uniref:Pimeloyl-ACP methyl ester carboxylesterase n=1 Tax=Shimia sagamensis TaxID=1566352 RepID=A0ABY1NVA2_9RHOB|nr:alpha/beta hydrolase [Shimia sagamensis]SMP18944.1 Pimeloyl-ACP methyl ester carboxylesterase [Shimia sagamensis]
MTSSQTPIFFCHGVPGGPDDATLLQTGDLPVTAPNLFDFATGEPLPHLFSMYDNACAEAGAGGMHVVGFSIGAMAALRLAAARPDTVSRVTVISPAAPLSLGNFLPEMAGAPVFKMAMQRSGVLRVLTAVQGLLARKAPGVLINQLFAKSGAQERSLFADAQFVAALTKGMHSSFGTHRSGYLDYLAAYVTDWSAEVRQVQAPVEIWHGEKDTWAPVAMAEAIKNLVSVPCSLQVVPDGEHYSTLKAVRIG